MEYEGNDGKQGMNCKKNSTYCTVHGKPYSSRILALMRNAKRDKCFMCSSTNNSTLPADYTLPASQTTSSSVSSEIGEVIKTIDFGVSAMHALDLVEDGIQWGRPAYRQIKYAMPLGGVEWGVDAGLQMYDDRGMNFADRVGRAIIRGAESAVIDGASTTMGLSSAAALQANIPVPLVPAGAGYVIGSYSTSWILENLASQVNPDLFSWAGLGGQ
jgi:hypothetical protein